MHTPVFAMKVLILRHKTFTRVYQHISIAFRYTGMYLHTKDIPKVHVQELDIGPKFSTDVLFLTGPEVSLTSHAGLKGIDYII